MIKISSTKVKYAILLTGIVVICGMVALFHNYQVHIQAMEFLNDEQTLLDSSDVELALWTKVQNSGGTGTSVTIRAWYCQADGKYYLFVPERLKGSMHWMISGADEILVDGRVITDGSLCDLEEGTWQVEILSAGDPGEEASREMTVELGFTAGTTSLFLNTDSGSLDFLHADKANQEAGSYLFLSGTDELIYQGRLEEMHCRGNASWSDTEKKSYQLTLMENVDLFGMGSDRQWLLLANAFDSTLLRNRIAFAFSRQLDLSFTPDTMSVDVYANGEFLGNYLLTEKVEIDQNRVNIRNLEKETEAMNAGTLLEESEFFMEQQGRLFSTKGYMIEKEPENISGGYLLEIEMSDRYGLEASGFITSRMQPVVFNSPAYASHAQVSYIANRYQDFEDAVFSEDGCSPYTGAHYTDYIDLQSFARKYLVEELTKNLDAAFTSQFFYKPDDSVSTRFFAGPAWDYDKSIGVSGTTENGIQLQDPEGLYAASKTKDSDIWYALYQQEDFRELAIRIYGEELEPAARLIANEVIGEMAKAQEDSALHNMIRWQVFGEEPGAEGKLARYYEEVDKLQDFLNRRLDFLNREWEVEADE